ncbi:hypothetical protein D3C87_1295200 [compost metagenome]
MVDGVEQLEAVPRLLRTPLLGKGKHYPGRRVGILSAVFAHTRRISLDITRIMRCPREWRGEQTDDTGLFIDQMLNDSVHRLP